MEEHTTGKENESHKDWVITSKKVAPGGVWYSEGVADHPLVQIQVNMGREWESDTAPVGHKPMGVRGCITSESSLSWDVDFRGLVDIPAIKKCFRPAPVHLCSLGKDC